LACFVRAYIGFSHYLNDKLDFVDVSTLAIRTFAFELFKREEASFRMIGESFRFVDTSNNSSF